MNPLTFSIQVENPALCPICRVELLGQVIHIYGGIVFCERCINNTQYFVLNRVLRRCRHPDFAELFSSHSGLVVLAPKRTTRPAVLNRLWCFENTDAHYDYPQFIGIVPEHYFKPSLGPPRTVADPRHPDHNPAPLSPVNVHIDHR